MRVIKSVFDFYVNSSTHVALAVVAMSYITYLEFGISIDYDMLFFIGFASITGYNFVKYFGLAKFHHRSLSNTLKSIQVFSLLCFIAMSYFILKLNTTSLITILILGAITFLYAIPLLPNRFFVDQKKKLRSISGLKIYIIALVWSAVTVILPFIGSSMSMYDDVLLSAIQRFLIVIVLMFPFEIRDLNYDSLKLATVPQRIGVKRTKVIGVVLMILVILLEFLKNNINPYHLLSLIVMLCVLSLFLAFSSKQQGQYYSAFWVEGIPVFWLIAFLIFG